jgi:hypothetical protein
VLLRRVGDLAEDAVLGRIGGEVDSVHGYGEFRYADTLHRDNLARPPNAPYGEIYCARGQGESVINAYKLHLAFDRASGTKRRAAAEEKIPSRSPSPLPAAFRLKISKDAPSPFSADTVSLVANPVS